MRKPKPFETRYKIDPMSSCWHWQGPYTADGYGRSTFGARSRVKFAHRWSWESINGPVPPDMELDHLCRTRNCVNPQHLEPVSRSENVRRSPVFMALARQRFLGRANPRQYQLPRGVYLNAKTGKFFARTEIVNGRFIHLGTFDNVESAVTARAQFKGE